MGAVGRYTFLVLVALLTLVPLMYAFFGAFKTLAELLKSGATLLPIDWTTENFRAAWTSGGFSRYVLNSVVVSAIVVSVTVFAATSAGYVMARVPIPGRRIILAMLGGALFLGLGTATLFPRLLIAKSLGLLNLVGVALVEVSGLVIVQTFLARAFAESLPRELEEAALVDGCGLLSAFWHIALPLLRPISSTIAILAFQASWNGFQIPLVFTLGDSSLRTLPVGVYTAAAAAGDGVYNYALLLAGTVLALTPVITLFVIAQGKMIDGLVEGALRQ